MGYRFTLGLWLPAVADENQILKLDFLQEEGAGWIFLWSDYATFQQLGRNLDLPRGWREHPDNRPWYDAFDWRSKYFQSVLFDYCSYDDKRSFLMWWWFWLVAINYEEFIIKDIKYVFSLHHLIIKLESLQLGN